MNTIRNLASALSRRAIPTAVVLTAVLCASVLQGQEPTRIAGTIVSGGTGARLSGIQLYLEDTDISAVSDASGAFLIDAPPGDYVLVARKIGRAPIRHKVTLRTGQTTRIEIRFSAEPVMLEDLIVVSATRTEALASEVAASMTVLSARSIATNPARATDDLLREVAGVDLPRASSTVSHPTSQSISIRGTGRARSLVLLDGIPLNDAFGGWVRWSRAPKNLIDRVEVLRGGGSSLFGTYGMGGVVQLFTRLPSPRTGFVETGGGNRDGRYVRGFAGHVMGNWGVTVAADVESGGGYVRRSRAQRGLIDIPASSDHRNVLVRAEYTPGLNNRLFFTADHFDEDRNTGTPLTSNDRRITTFGVGGEFGAIETGQVRANLFGSIHRFNNNNSRTAQDRSSETRVLRQAIPVEDIGGSFQWSRSVGPFQLLGAGVDARLIDGSNNEQVFTPTGAVAVTRSSGGRQLVGGVFSQGVIAPTHQLRIETSVRLDLWRNFNAARTIEGVGTTDFDSKTDAQITPRLAIRYQPHKLVAIRSAVYGGFRAPTLNELYRGFFASNINFDPNPDLGPESLTGADLGVDLNLWRGVQLRMTGFWNEINDQIVFVQVDSARRVRQNLGETRTLGLEVEAAVQVDEHVRLSANYTFLDAEIREAGSASIVGNTVPDVVRHSATVRASYASAPVGQATAMLRFTGEEFDNDRNTERLPSFVVFDLDLRRRVGRHLEAFVAIENVFNKRYVTGLFGSIEELGVPRTARGGINVHPF